MPTQLQWVLDAMLGLIPVSVGIKIVLLLIKINTDPDQAQQYKTRIKNALLFVAVSESAFGFLKIVYFYLI